MTRRSVTLLAAVLLLLVGGRARLSAQDLAVPADRLADSLAAMSDVEAVRMLDRGTGPARDGSTAEHHLRVALIQKRLFELTDDDEARERAQHSFDKVKDQDSRSTWGHFGYGWALAHAPDFRERFLRFVPGAALAESVSSIVGLDDGSRARRSLQNALAIDPAFEPAVRELAQLALLTKAPNDVAAAASASRKAIGAGLVSARIYTQLAELEMLRGNGAAAAEAARAGIALDASGSSRRALGIALLSVPADVDAGGEAYLNAMTDSAFADSAVQAAYYADVAPLLRPDERETWQSTAAAARATWLRAFWERSAARSARSVPDRLAEHFSRIQFANANYQRTGKLGQRAGTSFLLQTDASLPFDDRGLLYVRLGKPDEVISTPAGNLTPPPNESWVYRRDGAVEMYHFHKFQGSTEWLLSPLEDCDPFFIMMGQTESDRHKMSDMAVSLKTNAQSNPNGGLGAASRYLNYIEARAKYDRRLGTQMMRCQIALDDVGTLLKGDGQGLDAALVRLFGPGRAPPASGGSVDGLRLDGRQFAKENELQVRKALAADDARPRYDAPLQVITQLYAFRGDANATALTAAVLIPGERFTAQPIDGVLVYPLSLSLIVLDSVSGTIQRAEASPAFRANEAVGDEQYFRATLDMEATPMSSAEYRIVVENAARASEGDVWSGTRTIPSYNADSLMMSDLVVGEDGDGRWRRGVTTINPIPSHQVERGKTFKLFYEVYNMPVSTQYRTSISVEPEDGGGITNAIKSLVFGRRGKVDLTFDDVAAAPDGRYGLQQSRTIGGDLDAGSYTITVTVLDLATQTTTSKTTRLVILGPKDLREN